MNNGDKQEPKYSEIISMFKNNEVRETFELDLTTGAMVYNTLKSLKRLKSIMLKAFLFFLTISGDSVNEYNEANPDNQISFNYKVTNSRSWILSLLPILISVAGLVFFRLVHYEENG